MKRMKKVIALMLGVIVLMGLVPMAVTAGDGAAYEPDDAYELYFYGNSKIGKYLSYYGSPYSPLLQYDEAGDTPYNDVIGVNALYNQSTGESIPVYCVDQYTGIVAKTPYKRINVEDASFFGDEAAAHIRSIVLHGFPAVSNTALGEACGVGDLTVGEAVAATQLAVWQTAYGDAFEILDHADAVSNLWTKNIYKNYIANYDTYYNEYSGYAQDTELDVIGERIKQCTEYLLDLAPTAPAQKAVSGDSFIDWSSKPVLSDNGDGTYDVTVSITVDVFESAGDALTLSAVMGDKHVTVDLGNGKQTVALTIENVPAADIDEKITAAIDGDQTVGDVFLYTARGGRETAQQFVGYNTFTLSVHEEISIEPERIITFHKTDKILIGTDDNGDPIYDHVDLEGIVFDLYYVADWNDYLTGKTELPDIEDIDVSDLGGDNYHYPHFTVTTNENGYASVNLTKEGLPDGVYVIVERDHSAIVEPVSPFYAIIPYTNEDGTEWEYELNISPKNDVKGDVRIEKDVIRIGNDLASVDAYRDHVWIVGTSIPEDIGNGKEYIITDTIDSRLDYIGNMVIRIEYARTLPEGAETIEPLTLIPDTDYVLEVVDNDSLSEGKPCDSFTVSLTAEGMKKVGAFVGNDSASYMMRTYYDCRINANAVLGELIPNQAFLYYRNSVNYRFYVESDIPEVYTCGIRLLKVDSKDHAVYLEGAEFSVYRTVTAAELENESVEIVYIEGVSAPVTMVDFFDNVDLKGERVTTVTSDENGNIIIYGLADGSDYYSIAEVEYYLVETKAPVGYNLLASPVKLEINKISHLSENAIKIENVGGAILPETGGAGTKILITLGALLTAIPAICLYVKKVKAKAR